MNILLQGPSLLENFGRDKLCVMCILLCISHKYNIIVCVSMTSPFSQSPVVRSFCKIGKMGGNCGNDISWAPWPKRPPGYANIDNVYFSYLFPWFILEGVNSNVATKFVQLHYFFKQSIGEKIFFHPLSKREGDMFPPPPETRVNERSVAFSVMSVMLLSRHTSLGGPHISFLDLIKRSYRGWLGMMTSSEGPHFSSLPRAPQP